MTHLSNIIFIDNLPKIDLHGENAESARVIINDFVNDNYKQKNNIFCIVHGVGSGTLKKVTHDTLKKNKRVVDFKTFYYNQGCTITEIDLNIK